MGTASTQTTIALFLALSELAVDDKRRPPLVATALTESDHGRNLLLDGIHGEFEQRLANDPARPGRHILGSISPIRAKSQTPRHRSTQSFGALDCSECAKWL